MSQAKNKRSKHITRYIHRLFWEANFQSKSTLISTYCTRIPAIAAYNIFIPLAGAFAVQSILQHDISQVYTYVWWILGLAGVYSVLWTIGDITISKNAKVGGEFLQTKIFANFLQKDYDFFANTHMGSLGAQATRLRESLLRYGWLVTLAIPKQATIMIAGIAVIAYQSVLLAVITLISVVLVLSFTFLSSSWRIRFRRRVSKAASTVAGDIGDALSQGITVKTFTMERFEQHRLQKPLGEWGKAQYMAWVSAAPADVGRMLLAAITTVVLLLVSAHLYMQGAIEIAVVILVQLYVIRLIASTLEIADIVKHYEEIMGNAYEPAQTMLIPTTVQNPVKANRLIIKKSLPLTFQDVSFAYADVKQEQYALKDFTLEVKPGEKIGIVGHSGSGKTTLTKLLLRFMDVTHGKILLDNIDIRQMSQEALRKAISFVPQEPILFHRSIKDNIAYSRPATSQKEVERIAALAYVDEFVHDLPHGYNTMVGERGIKLSGGQRQRIAIARALLKDSPILVLDEATSALDSKSEQLIQSALWRLMKNRTTLVIAHRLSTIQRMDRIIVMDKGSIVQIGTHDQLKQQPGVYAELWSHQSGGYLGSEAK